MDLSTLNEMSVHFSTILPSASLQGERETSWGGGLPTQQLWGGPESPPSTRSGDGTTRGLFCLGRASVVGLSSEPRGPAPKQTLVYTELKHKRRTYRGILFLESEISANPLVFPMAQWFLGLKVGVPGVPEPLLGLSLEKSGVG